MTQELRLAFLGCGAISKFHLLGIRDAATQIKVTAAIDSTSARPDITRAVIRVTSSVVFPEPEPPATPIQTT